MRELQVKRSGALISFKEVCYGSVSTYISDQCVLFRLKRLLGLLQHLHS